MSPTDPGEPDSPPPSTTGPPPPSLLVAALYMVRWYQMTSVPSTNADYDAFMAVISHIDGYLDGL